MKKIIVFLTVAALLAIPVSSMAAKPGDWELVGYTKLETFWDSTQINKNLSGPLQRNNAVQPNNFGRLKFTAQSSRFGFKIKGPEVFGAKTEGYIEIDFDPNQDGRQSASNSYIPRMRHAWFRMDFGTWQVLMGQYWGVFCDFYPETVNDGPYQNHGQATQRIPQIRVTFKPGMGKSPWTFSALVGAPYDPAGDNVTGAYGSLVGSQAAAVNTAALWGQNSTFPQMQAQAIFEQDLYGKAAYAGKPRGFVANFGFGIQRITYLGGQINNGFSWGFNGYDLIGGRPLVQKDTQTLTPWCVQGTLFIPVIPTTTAKLAGTASITIQAQIGQGFSFYGNGTDGDNSFFAYDSPGFMGFPTAGNPGQNGQPNFINYIQHLNYKRKLTPKYGGYIQAQYYFTEQWFISGVYGFAKAYGVSRSRNYGINAAGFTATATAAGNNLNSGIQDPNNQENFAYASMNDQSLFTGEAQVNLFFKPNNNFKFGLGYSYMNSTYFQNTRVNSKESRDGYNHSVRFGGWFFF